MTALGSAVGALLALAVGHTGLWFVSVAEGYGWQIQGTLTSRQWAQLRSYQRAAGAVGVIMITIALYGVVHTLRDVAVAI